ncbi:hypothetical protein TSO221_20355 [Azospirillum sp. TSO22-1]|nr:hypothetical protein TSO221_20355 [Azospirillum sp. TSO22-1]
MAVGLPEGLALHHAVDEVVEQAEAPLMQWQFLADLGALHAAVGQRHHAQGQWVSRQFGQRLVVGQSFAQRVGARLDQIRGDLFVAQRLQGHRAGEPQLRVVAVLQRLVLDEPGRHDGWKL